MGCCSLLLYMKGTNIKNTKKIITRNLNFLSTFKQETNTNPPGMHSKLETSLRPPPSLFTFHCCGILVTVLFASWDRFKPGPFTPNGFRAPVPPMVRMHFSLPCDTESNPVCGGLVLTKLTIFSVWRCGLDHLMKDMKIVKYMFF